MALVEPCKNLPGYGPIPLDVGDVLDSTLVDLSGKANATHTHAPADITGTAVITSDSRLSDARTPLTHTHAPSDITGTAVVTADARLSDARTPTAHNQAWSTITATPTTVAGYGITDAASAAIAQFPTPTTGQTQTFNTAKKWEIIACNHTLTIAAQTFVFPVDANSQIGQELRIFSRSIITTVTLTLNSNTILGLALTTLPVSGTVAWRKVAASTWARIQ